MEQEQPKKSNLSQTLGIVGLVLGIVALVISFIPCLGMYAVFPGVIAIGLSIFAFLQANKEGASKGLIIAALVVSVLGTSIAVWQYFALKKATSELQKGLDEFQKEVNKALDTTKK